MSNWVRLLLAVTVLPLLGVSGFFALQEGRSALLCNGVEAHVRLWTNNPQALTKPIWQRVTGFVDMALQITPYDPQLLESAGAIAWWGARFAETETVAQAQLQSAMSYYRRSIAARPAWPDTWAYLAAVKNASQNWDLEFQTAYKHAWLLGKWRREIIWALVNTGLESWPHLVIAGRVVLAMALPRAARLNARNLISLTQKHPQGRQILCLAVQKQVFIQHYCQELGYGHNIH